MSYENLPKKFQGIVEETNYEKPEYNIDDDVRDYVDGVVNNPNDEQEYLVKKFIDSKVTLALHDWKSKYRQNDEIIENMESHHEVNNAKIEVLEGEKKDLQRKLKKIDSAKHENERHIEDVERTAPSADVNKKGTLYFLIFVAVGLAILTAYKFATAMGSISAATEGGTLNTFQYILYGLGSLAILATGKAINILYEKLQYSKTFFISVTVIAIILSAISAYSLAGDKAFLNSKANLTEKIASLEVKVSRLDSKIRKAKKKDKPFSAYEEQLKKIQLNLTKLQEKNVAMDDEAIGLDKAMLILIIFTEMFMGGLAWMYATDYSRYISEDKRSHSLKSVQKHIDSSDENKKSILEQIVFIDEKIEHIRLENHALHRVVADIKTEDEIENILQLIIDDETNMALSYLWKKNI